MKRIIRSVVHFLKREDGPTAVECALMLALVIVVSIVAINNGNTSRETPGEPVVVQNSAR